MIYDLQGRRYRVMIAALVVAMYVLASGCPRTDNGGGDADTGSDVGDTEELDADADRADADTSEADADADGPTDATDGDGEDPNCHTDCFGGLACEDGEVSRFEFGAKPCWAGQTCGQDYVGTCENGCAKSYIDEYELNADAGDTGDYWTVMCSDIAGDAGDTTSDADTGLDADDAQGDANDDG